MREHDTCIYIRQRKSTVLFSMGVDATVLFSFFPFSISFSLALALALALVFTLIAMCISAILLLCLTNNCLNLTKQTIQVLKVPNERIQQFI